MDPQPSVSVGFSFAPTPEDLVHGFLEPWIAGRPLGEAARAAVCFADPYGCDPATLTSMFEGSGHGGRWYFLCATRPAAAEGDARRCVGGGGAWGSTSQGRPSVEKGLRGESFEYVDAAGKKTAWRMEEFASALQKKKQATGDGAAVKVICKVYAVRRGQETRARAKAKMPLPPLPLEDLSFVETPPTETTGGQADVA